VKKYARDWSSLTDLHPMHGVALCDWLVGLLHRGTRATHSSQNCGRDSSLTLLPHHAGWINVVGMRAQSPLTVSGALRGLDGKKVEAPSTLHVSRS
jgi:hypothetical protein